MLMVKSTLPEQVLPQLEIQKGSTEKCEKLRDYVVAREKSDKTEPEKERSNPKGNANGSLNSNKSLQNRNEKFSLNKCGTSNKQFNSAEALVA